MFYVLEQDIASSLRELTVHLVQSVYARCLFSSIRGLVRDLRFFFRSTIRDFVFGNFPKIMLLVTYLDLSIFHLEY